MNHEDLTPIEAHDGILVKRDDLFSVNGMRGGKMRTALRIARPAVQAPERIYVDLDRYGLVTAGSRHSPQVAIVAAVAQHLGVPCRVHVPTGKSTPETERAKDYGAEVVRHTPGYNTVIDKRARDDAAGSGRQLVPFGMDHAEAIVGTARQLGNLPFGAARRIVVPVGSGMTLAGILHGLMENYGGPQHWAMPNVLGVLVGADPTKRLDRWVPDWRDMNVTLAPSGMDYDQHRSSVWHGISLDPVYEGKCVPFLGDGDLFWVVGHRDPFPTRWKISANWGMHAHDCTAEGITREGGCGGMCCRNQAFWPPKSGGDLGACVHLGPDGCRLTPDERPIKCLLYPLVPNRNGTLVRHYRAPSCGPCIGTGPPLIDALEPSLTALFGAEEYARIRASVHQGVDYIVVLPSELAAQLEREAEAERRNDIPTPRKETLQ